MLSHHNWKTTLIGLGGAVAVGIGEALLRGELTVEGIGAAALIAATGFLAGNKRKAVKEGDK